MFYKSKVSINQKTNIPTIKTDTLNDNKNPYYNKKD
jgi:hypothetical protein